MIQERDFTRPKHMNSFEYQKKYSNLLFELNETYNSKQQYMREYNVIEYVQKNILSVDIPLRVLRFYPIILQ